MTAMTLVKLALQPSRSMAAGGAAEYAPWDQTAALTQPGNMQDSAASHLQRLWQLCTLGARFLTGVNFSRAGRASKSSSSLGGRPVLWLEMPAFSSRSCSSFAAKAGFLQTATGRPCWIWPAHVLAITWCRSHIRLHGSHSEDQVLHCMRNAKDCL